MANVPQGFKDWLADNEQRIAEAKALPYFLRDNGVMEDGKYRLMEFKPQSKPQGGELDLIEALRTKFDGVNKNILGRVAKRLAETVASEEEVATAVAGITFQQFLDSYGDSTTGLCATAHQASSHPCWQRLRPPTSEAG